MNDVSIVGIDVGLVLHRPTSGICRTGKDGFLVDHTFIDKLSRQAIVGKQVKIDLLAIDGPILPRGSLNYLTRPVEKVFLWGAFRTRCPSGETRRGLGAALRRGGCDTASQFACQLTRRVKGQFPRVQVGLPIVEAFPNCFLGVMLEATAYPEPIPKFERGQRFEWLLTLWRRSTAYKALRDLLDWDQDNLWNELSKNSHHEQQAGLICALTGVCVHRNAYVAVGGPVTGYFFLPPWELWQPWAKEGLRVNRLDRRLSQCSEPVEIWISGQRIESTDALP